MKLRRTRSATPEAPNIIPTSCEELSAAPAAEPDPLQDPQCAGCQALGENVWAHLRMCLTCNYVGCCDSSPHRHATGHSHETDHLVMRSVEPGETWRWCFVHNKLG